MTLITRPDGITTWEDPRRRRRYPWKGMAVNPRRDAPDPSGPWVDETRCLVCGALYSAHRGSYGFQEAAQRIRQGAKAEGDAGGGYRSRRPVLWALRCLKLEDWYLEHWPCGSGWDFTRHAPHPLEDRNMERARLPAVVELAHEEPPTEVYVRGHFYAEDEDADRALEAGRIYLEDLAAEDWWEDWTPGRLGIARQLYARWGFPPGDYEGSARRWLHLRDEGGRGAFPITLLVDLDEIEDRRRRQAAIAARAAELEAVIRAWLPEALDVKGHGYPLDGGHVRFTLPGMNRPLTWRPEDPVHLTIAQEDAEAWATLYQGRPGRPLPLPPEARP